MECLVFHMGIHQRWMVGSFYQERCYQSYLWVQRVQRVQRGLESQVGQQVRPGLASLELQRNLKSQVGLRVQLVRRVLGIH